MPRINGTRGRGRPPKYVTDDMGNVIVGLSIDRSNGVYYNTHWRREGGKMFFGTHKVKAIQKYLQWRAEKSDKSVVIADNKFTPKQLRVIVDDGEDEYTYQLAELPESTIIEMCRTFLSSNSPHTAAQKLGIPKLSLLDDDDISKIKPPLTLDNIRDIYLNRTINPLSKNQKNEVLSWWGQFQSIINAKTIRDITRQDISSYQNQIHDLRNKKDYSPTWIKHRFDLIKTVLRYAQKQAEDSTDINRVLGYCQQFVYPKKNPPKPKPISKNNYNKLLDHVRDNPKYRSMLLLSLNCAMYPIDVTNVRLDDINLENRTLIMQRQKTGVIRVAVLWGETVEAITDYLRTKTDNSQYLYISKIGKKYKAIRLRRLFNSWLNKLGLDSTLCWEHIRDGAQTVGARAGIPLDTIRYLMGHKVSGITDHYLMRSPDLVRELCEVIRKHYLE